MTPWRKQGRPGFVTRVYAGNRQRVCSCGTTLKSVAQAVQGWVDTLHQSPDARSQAVLDAIVDRTITLPDAYRLGVEGTLARLAALEADAADVNLAPLLEEWLTLKAKARRGAATTPTYRRQILALFPESPLRRSLLTGPVIAQRLDALPVADPTRNRYRAALSGWCRWLVRRGVLTTNPARTIGGYAEPLKPVRFRSMADAERVVRCLVSANDRGRAALMAGTGMDWSDTVRLRVRDLDWSGDLPTVQCHGSKTPWRNRVIRITQAWAIPYVQEVVRGKLPDALVFHGANGPTLRRHKLACDAAHVERFSLHEWRDTYAVAELQAGQRPEVVAHQLGHKDPSLVWSRYGRYIPQAKDYRSAISPATQTATHHRTRTAR